MDNFFAVFGGRVSIWLMKVKQGLTRKNAKMKASNQAWLLLELLGVAKIVQQKSMCLGEIRPRHISIQGPTIVRSDERSFFTNFCDRLLMHLHEKFLHDESCHLLGVSKRAVIKLMHVTALREQELFLVEAVEEALSEFELRRSDLGCHELIQIKVTERITPRAPDSGGL